MATTESAPAGVAMPRAIMTPTRPPRWSWSQYLALAGLPILIWEGWTVTAWLTDGPHQITQFRDRNSIDWYGARVIESLCIAASLVVILYVVRGCLRQRRILTFDVMFCLAGATLFWADVGVNFFTPTFLASSNWTNLNNTCGHMPFVVNPDCGRVPDPILFNWLMETFLALGLAIAIGAGVRWAHNRWPALSNQQLGVLVLLTGIVVDGLIELTIIIPLHLYAYPSPTWMSVPIGRAFRYPLAEAFAGGLWIGIMACARIFRDDRGRTVFERDIERHSPRRQKAITLLALYGFFQILIWVVGDAPVMLYGPYESRWPRLPAYVVNDVCDAPGVHGTRYGPCPGSAGYRMPGRHSLPGRSP